MEEAMKTIEHPRVKILAINDEADVLVQISNTLSGAGYSCRCARDAQSASEAVREAMPDLIISDVNLAGHSGCALCEQLKQQAEIGDVPVMYLSAAQVPDIIRRSHAAGGTYYLRKPFDAEVLLQLIEQVLLPQLTGSQLAHI
jgi:CheY-like chemotaxis protein